MKLNLQIKISILALLFFFVDICVAQESKEQIQKLMHKNTSGFIENVGQWNNTSKFAVNLPGGMVFLDGQSFYIRWETKQIKERRIGSTVRIKPLHGESSPILGFNQTKQNTYVLGNSLKNTHSAPVFQVLRQENVWRGIDLISHIKNGIFEYDLSLQPGADLSDARFEVEGIDFPLSLNDKGELLIRTDNGTLSQVIPETFQIGQNGEKIPLKAQFVLLSYSTFGFKVDDWDPSLTLTVDPGFIWGSYIGATGSDLITAMARIDDDSYVVAGTTNSLNFPLTVGAWDNSSQGPFLDIFLTGISTNVATGGVPVLTYSTYFGGNLGNEGISELKYYGGDYFAVGHTTASDFPTTVNGYDRTYGGGQDAFFIQLTPASSYANFNLRYSTYLGGSQWEYANDFHYDAPNGFIAIVGETASSNFPTTTTAYQQSLNLTQGLYADAFLTRIRISGPASTQLLYSTFLGGSRTDRALRVVYDNNLGYFIAGDTYSANFPVTPGAGDTTHNSTTPTPLEDNFFTFLDLQFSGVNQLRYSTFFGGSGRDLLAGLHVNYSASPKVATIAGSTSSFFLPTSANVWANSNHGNINTNPWDGYVARFTFPTSGLSTLLYSGYVGGSGDDYIYDMHTDSSGIVTIAGTTTSVPSIPAPFSMSGYTTTFGAYNDTPAGSNDGFVTRMDLTKPSTSAYLYSTYFGGPNLDYVYEVEVNSTGIITIAGVTNSVNFPVSAGAYSTTPLGGNDGFLVKLDSFKASSTTVGSGCAGSMGAPGVTVSGKAILGQPFTAQVTNLPLNQAFGIVGFSGTNSSLGALPFDLSNLGSPAGCYLRTSMDRVSLISGSGNIATYQFNIPQNVSYLGLHFWFQAASIDPPTSPLGLIPSSTVKNRIGNY